MTVLLRSWPKGLAAIGQETLLHDLGVFLRQNHRPAGGSDEPIGTLDHAVTLARGLAFDLAGRRDFEALLGTALGLELGHLASLVWPASATGGAEFRRLESMRAATACPAGRLLRATL